MVSSFMPSEESEDALRTVTQERDEAVAWIRAIGRICRAAAQGDLEHRLTRVDNRLGIADDLFSVNDAMDTADAFVRESAAALVAASERRFHRDLRPRGLQGAFLRAAGLINEAIGEMKAKHELLESVRENRLVLADQFEERIAEVALAVAAAATQTRVTAEQLAHTTSENKDRANNVAAAAEEASVSVQDVLSNMDEMAEVTEAIDRESVSAGDVARQATVQMSSAREMVDRLANASSTISGVIGLINTIADQTNLLALNATLEAARAGEAGKGFAVVAGEVKDLARQTREATTDVEAQVSTIQHSVGAVSSSMDEVRDVIDEIGQGTERIGETVLRQRTAAEAIHRSLHEASLGATEVSTHVLGVSDAAVETESVAESLGQASSELSELAATLQQDVSEFLRVLRAG